MSSFDEIREAMITELQSQRDEHFNNKVLCGVHKYWKTLSDFCKWHIDNRATKDLREDLRLDMEEIIFNQEIVDSVIDSMTEEEIRYSSLKSYKRKVGKISLESQVNEMLSWGYEMPDLKKNEEYIYLLVKLTVDESVDHEEVVNECDYVFTHDHILGSEIVDYRSEQEGESPVLYFP